MTHNLRKIMFGGLVALALSSYMPKLNAAAQVPQAAVNYQAQSGQSPGERKPEAVRFRHTEQKYFVDGRGRTRPVEKESEFGSANPKYEFLSQEEAALRYAKLKSEGKLSNFEDLETKMQEVIDGMSGNPRYLAESGFAFGYDGDGATKNLTATKSEGNLNISLNAGGSFVDGKFVIDNLRMYSIDGNGKSMLSMRNSERWQARMTTSDGGIAEYHTYIEGTRAYNPELKKRWESMEAGMKAQDITRQSVMTNRGSSR